MFDGLRFPRLLLLLGVGAISSATACADQPAEEEDDDSAAITTTNVRDKAEVFKNEIYYVRVTSWDSSKMSVQALRDEQKVRGSELSVFTANPDSTLHCPDAESSDDNLIFKTKAFSLRTSGNLTNGTPKSSIKVGLEDKEDRLFGMSALNLKSMWNDVSQMREALAWRLFAEAGVRAPRHTYAKLCINGRYYGLYSMIEQIDKSFIKERYGKNDEGNLYKAYWADIGPATLEMRKGSDGDSSGKQYFKKSDIDERSYQLKTNDKNSDPAELRSYDDLATFIRTLNADGQRNPQFDTAEYAASMEAVFDVKGFLRWASVNSLLGAWDNYWATPANYYLYNSGKRGDENGFMQKPYFSWIPWDYDNTFGIDFHNARWQNASIIDWPSATRAYYQGNSTAKLPLITNLLQNTKFLRYYLDSIEHLNDAFFTDAWINKQIGDERSGLRHRVQAAAYLESDSPTGAPHTGRRWTNDEIYKHGFMHDEIQRDSQHIDGILHFVRMRHDAVKRELSELRRKHPKGSSGESFPARPSDLP